MDNILFELKGVKKTYNNSEFVLEIPSLIFQWDRIYALVGPNGSGKTTLLRLLNFLEKPPQGKILYQGTDPWTIKGGPLKARRQMAVVMQNPFFFRTTVFNNIAYGLRVRHIRRAEIKARVANALELVGLRGFEDRMVQELSGGEAQKVALARALCLEAKILLLDEFLANLDKDSSGLVEKLFERIKANQQITIIFTTHDLEQAYRLGDEVLAINNGKIKGIPLRQESRGDK